MPKNSASGDGLDTHPSPRRAEPDAHGQASLLLTESILHALVETGTLTTDQAIGVVRTASEVKVEVAAEIGESRGRMKQSIGLLSAIELSLAAGGKGDGGAG